MRITILGCGKFGANLAIVLHHAQHEVRVVDLNQESFHRLPSYLREQAVQGDGLDEESLRKAGVASSEVFVAATDSDATNAMAGQIAKFVFNVPLVISCFHDVVLSEVCSSLGIEPVNPVSSMTSEVMNLLRRG